MHAHWAHKIGLGFIYSLPCVSKSTSRFGLGWEFDNINKVPVFVICTNIKTRCKKIEPVCDKVFIAHSKCYHVPDSKARLLSPQRLFNSKLGVSGRYIVGEHKSTLEYDGVGP